MSLKDSMIRGLAVYGLSSMSQCGRANSKRKVMIMSLKDSMIRGLALSGMDAIARAGYADSKMFADIINAANKDAR